MSAPHMATARRRCLVTGKQVHPGEGFGFCHGGAVFYSFEGMEKHEACLRLLAGGPPPERCQECNQDSALSRNEQGHPALYVHLKDGLYQALCRRCSDRYEAQARELYKDTPYGAARNL